MHLLTISDNVDSSRARLTSVHYNELRSYSTNSTAPTLLAFIPSLAAQWLPFLSLRHIFVTIYLLLNFAHRHLVVWFSSTLSLNFPIPIPVPYPCKWWILKFEINTSLTIRFCMFVNVPYTLCTPKGDMQLWLGTMSSGCLIQVQLSKQLNASTTTQFIWTRQVEPPWYDRNTAWC